jgi:hypothetical protein
MNTKNWIRIGVLTGLLAWPAVESYRLYVAQRQLEASLQLQSQVNGRLQIARLNHSQATKRTDSPVSFQKH